MKSRTDEACVLNIINQRYFSHAVDIEVPSDNILYKTMFQKFVPPGSNLKIMEKVEVSQIKKLKIQHKNLLLKVKQQRYLLSVHSKFSQLLRLERLRTTNYYS